MLLNDQQLLSIQEHAFDAFAVPEPVDDGGIFDEGGVDADDDDIFDESERAVGQAGGFFVHIKIKDRTTKVITQEHRY